MRRLLTFLFAGVISAATYGQGSHNFDPITSGLKEQIQQTQADEKIRINIRLKDQFDIEQFLDTRQGLSREQQRTLLVQELKVFSGDSQEGLLDELDYLARAGLVANINPLWIASIITCEATPDVIAQLAVHPDIERIDYDEERILVDPIQAGGDGTGEQISQIAWNVLKVNAPDVWAQGFTGQGIVVGILDTGVNYNHHDIVNNMWEHPNFPFHGWNFIHNNNNPMDDHGHGSHVAGTVAGDGTSGQQTGIAPDAQIMALKVLSATGGGTESGVWNGIEFAVEHGAHVINLSLGWLHAWGPDRATWRNIMVNAKAAGVIASVAAGNEGNMQGSFPIPSNVRTPGDCPPPWLHPNQTLIGGTSAVVSVGATNSADAIAGFSSRGPVTWQAVSGFNDYPFNPGIGLIRPDIVAPGVNIISLRHNNNTGYTDSDGTSMAAPCVAGVMALILSKNTDLTPAEVSQILEENTVVLQPGKNNTTGSGRVNALAAVNATNYPGPIYLSHIFDDSAGNNDGNLNPGESILLTISMLNRGSEPFDDITVYISTTSPFIDVTDSIAYYGDFSPGDTIAINNGFAFDVAENVLGGDTINFTVTASGEMGEWESYFIAVAFAPRLAAGSLSISDPNGNSNGVLDPGETAVVQIPTLNIGQISISNVVASLTTQNPYVSIGTSNINLGTIAAGSQLIASFPVTVSPDAPLGETVRFNFSASSGPHFFQRTYSHKIGILIDDFETGDFSLFNWTFAGNLPWTITTETPFEGTYSARSGSITHNQTSELIIHHEVSVDDSVSFYRRVSSESGFDVLRFYINNIEVGEWSGNVPWRRVVFPVTAGMRTFRWEYSKDGSISGESDRAWIDYIVFPPMLIATSNAGDDASICQGDTHQLNGQTTNHQLFFWSTSGNGTFNNPLTLNPVYTPGSADINNGSALLTLNVIRNNVTVTDNMVLTINRLPVVSAGVNTAVCQGSSLLLENASASFYSQLLWTTSGTGLFDDATILNPTYTPSPEDIAAGNVTLTLQAAGLEPCGDTSHSIVVGIVPQPQAFAGNNTIICRDATVQLQASASNYSALLWTTSGTGTFSNNSILNPVYTPSDADIAAGNVTLTLTAAGIVPCANASGEMTVQILALPTAEISGDQTICIGQQAQLTFSLSGTPPWTVVDANNVVHTITESPWVLNVSPQVTTTFTLLSVTDANNCTNAATGSAIVTVNPLPLATAKPAGPDTVDFVHHTSSVFTIEPVATATAYSWNILPAEAGTITPDGTSATVAWSATYQGNVIVKAVAHNDCGEGEWSAGKQVLLKNTTGTGDIARDWGLNIYPNPSQGTFTLTLTPARSTHASITVTNLVGKVVYSEQVSLGDNRFTKTVNLEHLESGIYILSVESAEMSVYRKMIIRR